MGIIGLFSRNYNKPGPGVPKNAPKKKGFFRFVEILGRDIGNLVKLNLLFFVIVLPAQILLGLASPLLLGGYLGMFGVFFALALAASVVVGPGMTAMYLLVSKMLRDNPGFLWHDFKKAFKENFKQTALPGIFFSLILGGWYIAFALLTQQPEAAHSFALLIVFLFSMLLFMMVTPYYFLQAAYLDLGNAPLLRNSLLLSFANAPRSLGGAVLGGGLVLLQYLFLPYTAPVLLLVGYTIPVLLLLMLVWPPVDKQFEIDATLQQRAKQEMSEAVERMEAESKK